MNAGVGGTSRQICGYVAVREAARDIATYSSDLVGDRHARTYKQLPLEVDPPRHTELRAALQPLFARSAIDPFLPRFKELARRTIAEARPNGCEVVSEIALPYVVGCFGVVYNRPQDFDEWLAWGADVFGGDPGSGAVEGKPGPGFAVQRYLDRVFEKAVAEPNRDPERMDIWDTVSQLTIAGQAISRRDMYGIGNLLLAGGRDTLMKLVTGFIWHLVRSPDDREFLRENPDSGVPHALTEMVRYLTPLTSMERVLPEDRATPYQLRDPANYVLLDFTSANFDRSVWPNAQILDLRRRIIPNVAFGFGPHSCLGVGMARTVTRGFVAALLSEWPGWEFDGEPDIEWISDGWGEDGTYLREFRCVRVCVRRGE